MIVVGVDPGGRDTGIVVIDNAPAVTRERPAGTIDLLTHVTLRRDLDNRPIAEVSADYLREVNGTILEFVVRYGDPDYLHPRTLIAVEGVVKPSGHAAGRRGHLIDPSGLIATAQVVGGILGRVWSVPVVRVPPGGNGTALPWTAYPEPIRAKSPAGQDNRRHARSAYDVALLATQTYRLELARNRP